MTSQRTHKNKEIVWEFWQALNGARFDDLPAVINRYLDKDVVCLGPHPINELTGISRLISRFWQPIVPLPCWPCMFIAACMAYLWQIPMTVVSVRVDGDRSGALNRAQHYLQGKNIHADFVERKGNPATEIGNAKKTSHSL